MIHERQNHKPFLSKSKELAIVRFFIALALAIADTVWALYFDSFGLSESTIGFISSALVALTFLAVLFATQILERFKQGRILGLTIIVGGIAYFWIGFERSLVLFIIMAAILTVMDVFRIGSFNIMFRDSTSSKKLNKEEGVLYALLNVAWVVGPLIAGFALATFGISSVFAIAGIGYVISFLLFLSFRVKEKSKTRKTYNSNIMRNIKQFFSNKKLLLPYIMSVGIRIWWAFVYIYMPLFIIHEGLTEATVAYFLAIIALPLVFFEISVGKLSGKYGFRFFFVTGFLGVSLLSFSLFFVKSIMIQIVVVCVASIFMALVEPLQDTFFFKQVKSKDEERYYPFFQTSSTAGNFIGKFTVALGLLFLPRQYAYLIIGSLIFICFVCACYIKRNDK